MPYIITTLKPQWGEPSLAVARRSSHAVATLEEARDTAATELEGSPSWIGTTYPDNDLPRLTAQAESLPESGGTVGPLPDGTVIEVRPIEWNDLGNDLEAAGIDPEATRDLIDAFNAR